MPQVPSPWVRLAGVIILCCSLISTMLLVGPTVAQEAPRWVQSGFAGVTVGQVVTDPGTPGRVYATLAFGDVFRSNNSGISWEPLYDFGYVDPPTLAVDPRTPTTLYASNVAYAYKSIDGGTGWSQLAELGDIRAWAIDPAEPNRVYAGGTADRLYRSTNGGGTWTLALSLADTRDLALAPSDGTVYAGLVNQQPAAQSDGVYRSRDYGVSWSKVFTSSLVSALAVDPGDSRIVYVGTDGEGLQKSSDGGATWTAINSGLSNTVIRDLVVDPGDPRTLYAGTWGGGVFQSRDGGEQWNPLNDGLGNLFVSTLALDPRGDGVLFAGTTSGGLYHIQLVPPLPGPDETYVRVTGVDGRPVAGATIFRNGMQVRDAEGRLRLTDSAGNLILTGSQVGDQLVAMALQHEEPSARAGHDAWAYRIYTTSLGVQEDGALQLTTVARSPGRTDLSIAPTSALVLFNLVVSIEWDADAAYVEQIRRAMQAASDVLYDLSDGQMAFGQVSIYTGARYWTDADIQIATNNVVRPHAFVGGILSSDKAHVIRVGRAWDGRSGNQGPWDASDGYRTLTHEFGHYGLFLYDEYFGYRFDAGGNLAGERPTSCTGPANRDPARSATNASVMDYQYTSSELSMRDVPGLWSELCTLTAQVQLNGESAWETLARRYVDTSARNRWRIRTPAERGGVVAGPAELPNGVLDLPEIRTPGPEIQRPALNLTVINPDGAGHRGAIVALYKRDGRVIGQGFTNGAGQLSVYGAEPGDVLRAASADGALGGRIDVGASLDLVLPLRTVGSAGLATDGALPHLRLVAAPGPAGAGQIELLILLQNFAPDTDPTVLISAPDSDISRSPELSYSAVREGYEARISFSATARGSGQLRADRRVGGDRAVIQTFYRLQRIEPRGAWEVFSNDGNLWLNGGPGSLPGQESYLVVMAPGSLPGAPPTGHVVVGEPYDITASGAVVSLEQPAVLSLRYDDALVNGRLPAGLNIFHWNPTQRTWEPVTSRVDEAQRTLVAEVRTLGMYVLFAPAGPWTEARPGRVALPLVRR